MKVKSSLFFCLVIAVAATPALGQMGWCWGLDFFRTSVAEGVITITHENALYNCCPDWFDYSITQEGSLLSVTETEVAAMPCACLCCYSIPVEIGPLAPGPYQIDFFWHDETGPRHVYLDVTVPEWGGRGEFAGRGTQVDPPPCIDEPTVAPVPEPLGHGQPTASSLELTSCYPNPARGGVTIRYTLPDDGLIRLAIFGPGGSLVRSLFDGHSPMGPGSALWDGRDDGGVAVAAGVYFCRLIGERGSSQSRVIVVH